MNSEAENKVILTLLANPEFIRACDERATKGRQSFAITIVERVSEVVVRLNQIQEP